MDDCILIKTNLTSSGDDGGCETQIKCANTQTLKKYTDNTDYFFAYIEWNR